jgi:hypothetical protein
VLSSEDFRDAQHIGLRERTVDGRGGRSPVAPAARTSIRSDSHSAKDDPSRSNIGPISAKPLPVKAAPNSRDMVIAARNSSDARDAAATGQLAVSARTLS